MAEALGKIENKYNAHFDYEDWNDIDISATENSALTEAKRYYYYSVKPSAGSGWHYDADGMPALW